MEQEWPGTSVREVRSKRQVGDGGAGGGGAGAGKRVHPRWVGRSC